MTPPPTHEELLRHAPFLRRLARSLTWDEQTASDLVQETWLTALERPPRHQGNLGAWLRTVTTTHAFRRLRTQKRRTRREVEAARPEQQPSVAETVARESQLRTVTDAVLELGNPYREVLLLRFFEDLPPRRIAQRLDRPLNTVNSQLKRGLHKLRALLDERHGGDRRAWSAGLVAAVAALPDDGATALPAGTEAAQGLGPKVLLGSFAGIALVAVAWLGRGGLLAAPDEPLDATAGAAAAESGAGAVLVAPETGREPIATAAPSDHAATGSGATAPQPVAPVEPGGRRVEVTVVDAAGEPVAGATVAVSRYGHSDPADYGAWQPRGETGTEGRLVVAVGDENVAPPRGVDAQEPRAGVVVLAPGFVASQAHYVLCAENELRRLRVQLDGAPALEIRGRVLDAAGVPLSRAKVAIANIDLEPRVAGEVLLTAAPLERLTGPDGRFALPNLRRGRHLLFATSPGYVPAWSWQDGTTAAVVECVFHLRRGGRVSGVVRDVEGRPVPHAEVGYELPTGSAPKVAPADAGGRFALEGVPPGRLHVWARDAREPTFFARGLLRADAGAELTWDPVLREVDGIRLRLEDSRGEPLAGWFVRLEAADPSQPWVRRLSADAEGRVALFDCPDGALRADLFPSSIAAQTRSFPVESVDGLRSRSRERTLVVRARLQDRGILAGRLLDAGGHPFEEAHLYVREVRGSHARKFPVDRDGRFRIENVPPGRYEVRAWCGLAGSTQLGRHRVARRKELDLGELRAPAPGTLAVDWHWPDDPRAFAFQLVSRDEAPSDEWVQWSIDGGQWSIDEGLGRPRAAYALLPGSYGLQVVREGVVVERALVRIESGAEERLTIGSAPR